MSEKPIAVVTGANRGIGLETSRQLAGKGYHVILTARATLKGELAAQKLRDEGLDVEFQTLDVTALDSIKRLAQYIQKEHGRLDVLVNNAGIFPDPSPGEPESSALKADIEILRQAMETNTFGALRVCQSLVPLMQGRRGRVVNMSSGMGQLSEMNGCCPAYRLSKTALNAVTRILADELQDTGVKVNSVCPGWVQTDMGGPNATRTVAEGADTVVWLATLPEDGPSGGFFRDREQIPW
jgi:NAD(P)-dependent dehydrogenase (short-subunit alcohol dehydrogenase family)